MPFLFIGLTVFAVLVVFLMRTRRFYFVRHGETLLNAQHIRQGEEGGLSENGRRQAERVGKVFKNLSINRIISSSYPRARETATILNAYLKVPIIYSQLLVERKNPSEIIGKNTRDADVTRIVAHIDLSYHDDDYRLSDEENFTDLKKRARKCLNLLALQGTRNTVIITHHHFLKMLIAYMLYNKRLHAADFVKLSFFNIYDNAGITVCQFNPWKIFSKTRGWKVVSYNEQP